MGSTKWAWPRYCSASWPTRRCLFQTACLRGGVSRDGSRRTIEQEVVREVSEASTSSETYSCSFGESEASSPALSSCEKPLSQLFLFWSLLPVRLGCFISDIYQPSICLSANM